jgi:hypothetical protein
MLKFQALLSSFVEGPYSSSATGNNENWQCTHPLFQIGAGDNPCSSPTQDEHASDGAGEALGQSTLSVERFLDHLKTRPWYKGEISHVHTKSATSATFVDASNWISADVAAALQDALQIDCCKLYAHQVEAIKKTGNVVVATSTSR